MTILFKSEWNIGPPNKMLSWFYYDTSSSYHWICIKDIHFRRNLTSSDYKNNVLKICKNWDKRYIIRAALTVTLTVEWRTVLQCPAANSTPLASVWDGHNVIHYALMTTCGLLLSISTRVRCSLLPDHHTKDTGAVFNNSFQHNLFNII